MWNMYRPRVDREMSLIEALSPPNWFDFDQYPRCGASRMSGDRFPRFANAPKPTVPLMWSGSTNPTSPPIAFSPRSVFPHAFCDTKLQIKRTTHTAIRLSIGPSMLAMRHGHSELRLSDHGRSPAGANPERKSHTGPAAVPRPSPAVPRLELDAEADADRAPCLKDARIVDWKPVLAAVTVLVLRQEGASRPARLRVVHVVRLRADRARRPKIGLERDDALRVEQIRRLHVEREVLPPRGEIPLPLHGERRRGGQALRVHQLRILLAFPALVRRIREPGPELIDERRPPVLLVRQTQGRRERVALIPPERLLGRGLELIAEIPLVLERAVRVGRGARHVAVAVVQLPAEPVAEPLDERELEAPRRGIVSVDVGFHEGRDPRDFLGHGGEESKYVLEVHAELPEHGVREHVLNPELIADRGLGLEIGIATDLGRREAPLIDDRAVGHLEEAAVVKAHDV